MCVCGVCCVRGECVWGECVCVCGVVSVVCVFVREGVSVCGGGGSVCGFCVVVCVCEGV